MNLKLSNCLSVSECAKFYIVYIVDAEDHLSHVRDLHIKYVFMI